MHSGQGCLNSGQTGGWIEEMTLRFAKGCPVLVFVLPKKERLLGVVALPLR